VGVVVDGWRVSRKGLEATRKVFSTKRAKTNQRVRFVNCAKPGTDRISSLVPELLRDVIKMMKQKMARYEDEWIWYGLL